jgi:hypothetical protein
MPLLLDNSSDTVLSLKRFNHKVCGGAGCYILPSDHADTDQFAHFSILVSCEKYGERHQRAGASPALWTPAPWGTDCLSPTPPRQLLWLGTKNCIGRYA